MRAIDADRLIQTFLKAEYKTKQSSAANHAGNNVLHYYALKLISQAPTLDLILRGRWHEENGAIVCPYCKHRKENIKVEPNYCENCGAKLVKNQKE